MIYEFKVRHIPIDGGNRPGIKAEKNSFTVHNTDNTASDENETKNLGRIDNYSELGFNYACDEDSVTETIPPDEVTYHCGNEYGNFHSVSLEIACRPGAEDVAIEFIADKFVEWNWNIDVLTNHKYWNGKNCPSQILPHWDKFVARILKRIQEKRGKNKMDKIVTYAGDGDVFAAIIVSQKNHCPLMSEVDYQASGMDVPEVITIGGGPGTDRFKSFKEAAQLV